MKHRYPVHLLKEKIEAYPSGLRGDHYLNPDMKPSGPYKPAAVLIPIVENEDHYSILFTKRTPHLSAHAGQVSFPGGCYDSTDDDLIMTALREAREEIDLTEDQVEILGTLDTYITRTKYEVTPVAGLVRPPLDLTPEPREVAAIFEVPLDYILKPESIQKRVVEVAGKEHFYHSIEYDEWQIWGATAGMLINFIEAIDEGFKV